MDTVVPSMPKKPLEEPDGSKYHLEVAAIDEKIEQLNEEFKEKKAQRSEKRGQMIDGQHGRNPVREKLNELYNELKVYTD